MAAQGTSGGSAIGAAAVTPSNTANVTFATTGGGAVWCQGIYVGNTGNVSVQMIGGSNTVFPYVPAGSFLPVRVQKVLTDTTATNMVAVF